MTTSHWQASLATDEPASVDVAVVGGGVMGAAAAYWLGQREPGLRVALVEAGQPAQGASGRNAGFILAGVTSDFAHDVDTLGMDRARRLLAFTRENRRLLSDALDPDAFGLRSTGSWILAGSPAEADRLTRAAALLAEEGVPAEAADAEALAARTGTRGFLGGLFLPDNAEVHPARLVRRLIEESGADLHTHRPVTALSPDGAGFRLDTPTGPIHAERVLLTLNAYLPRLVPALAHVVRPVRAQMFSTAPAPPRTLGAPVYSHDGHYYLRQLDDGRVLVGGARHRHVDAEVGYDDTTTPALQADLEAYLAEHFPALASASVERRWSGTMGFSPDGLPVVGTVPGLDGAWFAAGFTGHGMGYGVRMGRLLADTVLGQGDDAFDLFTAERLSQKPVPA